MATIVLSAVGAGIGSALGGSVLGLSSVVIGRAVGATIGQVIDQQILGVGAEPVAVGETGVIVDCTAPEPLASAVVDLLTDAGRRDTMGRAGRLHVTQHLDWSALATQAQALFESGT